MTAPLKPGDTIGIIGGGQLGRMLAIAAGRLGFRCIVLDPAKNCPAQQFANEQILAAYDDVAGLQQLARRCDVVTYEFENVPSSTLRAAFVKTALYPPINALEISQDRLTEKQFLNGLDVSTAPYQAVDPETYSAALGGFGNRGILKTRRFGYDGKGQLSVDGNNVAEALALISSEAPDTFILEGFVPFEREVSVMAAKSQNGNVSCFDIAENVHEDGILRTSTVPAKLSKSATQSARAAAVKILDALDYVGILGIEFFVGAGEELRVNEFAPRVHNSGHWTEAACVVSQFEQHIRAICGLPLASTARHSDCVMENLIGDDVNQVNDLVLEENCLVHLYGKDEVRRGRKMGHVSRLVR